MTSREIVRKTVLFQNPERMAYDLPPEFGTDFDRAAGGMNPSVDARPRNGRDDWGAVWENIGISNLGQVKEYPLKDWSEIDKLSIPDIALPSRWTNLEGGRRRAGDRFWLAGGCSLYERVHFLRGLENAWTDIYDAPEELGRLIDLLADMNIYAVRKYAAAGVDGIIWCDDWGLQDRLMISPEKWREIWKPRYARVYREAHKLGLFTFLHSCGYIMDILDDLIDAGLDVIQMDQQQNMGLGLLSERFGGRITFWCPVDIQNTMVQGTLDEIRRYARRMAGTLGKPQGGFIAKWYPDPVGAGHRPEAVKAMSEEFLAVSREPVPA